MIVIMKKEFKAKGTKKEQKLLTTKKDTTLRIICYIRILASKFFKKIPNKSISISKLKNRKVKIEIMDEDWDYDQKNTSDKN